MIPHTDSSHCTMRHCIGGNLGNILLLLLFFIMREWSLPTFAEWNLHATALYLVSNFKQPSSLPKSTFGLLSFPGPPWLPGRQKLHQLRPGVATGIHIHGLVPWPLFARADRKISEAETAPQFFCFFFFFFFITVHLLTSTFFFFFSLSPPPVRKK